MGLRDDLKEMDAQVGHADSETSRMVDVRCYS